MNELTTNEIVFLMKLVGGIADGLDAIDPQIHSDEDDLGSAYNCALRLRRKLFDEFELRVRNEAENI